MPNIVIKSVKKQNEKLLVICSTNNAKINISSDSHVYKHPIKEKEVRIKPDWFDIKELCKALKVSMTKENLKLENNSLELENYKLKTLDRILDNYKSRNENKYLLKNLSKTNNFMISSEKDLIKTSISNLDQNLKESRRFTTKDRIRKSNMLNLTMRKSTIDFRDKIKPQTQQTEYVTLNQLSKTKYLDEQILLTPRERWTNGQPIPKSVKTTRKSLGTDNLIDMNSSKYFKNSQINNIFELNLDLI